MKRMVVIWSIICVSLLSCIPIVFILAKYFDIGDVSFFDYLLSSSEVYIGLPFDSVQNVYITIFTCFIGMYFTVLGIMMTNLKVAFIDFFKFSFELKSVIFSISILLQFLEIVFILPQIPYLIISEILLYIFIISLLFFALESIIQMSVLQNYKKCLTLFVKKSKHGNEKKIRDFYTNFVCKCFSDKSITVLDDFFKELRKYKNNKFNTLDICLKLMNSIESDNKKIYRAKMQFLIKRIMDCIAVRKYEKIQELISTYFSVYQKMIVSKNEKKYSYLLEIRDSVYFTLIDNRENKKLQSFYFQIVGESKNIIMYSLYNCPESVVYQEIKDFIYLKQLLTTYNEFEKLCLYHSQIFIDILCRVLNFIKVNGKCFSILKAYIDQLELVESIMLSDLDTELYQEEQVNTSFHEIKDTRNYYIALLLCYYCSRFGKSKVYKVIQKLCYIRQNVDYQEWKYKCILETFENITQESFEKILGLKVDKLKSVSVVKEKLNSLVNEIKNKEKKELQNKDASKLLEKEIERQRNKVFSDFKDYSQYDSSRKSDYTLQSVKSNFCISKKRLTDNSVISFDSNYCSFIEPLLYQSLSKILQKSEIKSISSVLEIDGLLKEEKKKNLLLVPASYRKYFSGANISDIKYLAPNTIQIGDYIFDFEYFYAPDGLIIKKSDFYSVVSLKEIKILNKEPWIENGDDFVMNVNIQLVFAFDKTKKITMYRLEY